ncbi:MAG: ATP-dependent zinc protease [Akkermansiaceae bacterium]
MPKSYIATLELGQKTVTELAAELSLPVKGRLKPRLMIGRREWLVLPDLGVDIVTAKVDTGAYTSSLHAAEIQPFVRDGVAWVKFLTHNHHGDEIHCEAKVQQQKKIKSSTGKGRMRYVIRTTAETIGGFRWEVLFSLADRSVMKCPLLLGRRALSGYFVVDPQASRLFGNIKTLTGHSHHRI